MERINEEFGIDAEKAPRSEVLLGCQKTVARAGLWSYDPRGWWSIFGSVFDSW